MTGNTQFAACGLPRAVLCRAALGLLLAMAAGAVGCGPATRAENPPKQPNSQPDEDAPHQAPAPNVEKLVDPPGIHNLVRVGEAIYSGSEPHGDEAFASLAKLGVKTIVSVDGAMPNLKAAQAHGMRYVHIPIGYHGIDRRPALSLVRVGRQIEGPTYVHCHHGRHRGPAAAAVVCMAADGRSGKQARAILEAAGTGKNYAGLWRDVEQFALPAADVALPALVEQAQVESFAAAMAKLDRHYDNLKLCADAQWQTPAGHPDLVAAQEALILKEALRESVRHLANERPAVFRAWLAESENLAGQLETALNDDDAATATARFTALSASCKQCHAKYRN